MDSSWSLLERESPSPPLLKSPYSKSSQPHTQPQLQPQPPPPPPLQQPPPLPPPMSLLNNSASQTTLPQQQQVSQVQANVLDNRLPATALPPPIFGHYPPYQTPTVDNRTLFNNQNVPATQQTYSNSALPTYNPYANSFQRRRQAYDSRNNGVISKIAEEKTRSAFNSIEIILDTFSSLSAILENTYSAIYGSFRTITNVADHIIFLRNHLAELALLPRAIHILWRFCKWLLHALGLGQTKLLQQLDNRIKSKIWNESLNSFETNDETLKTFDFNDIASSSSSTWPILAFISLVFGTPYIVRKLLGEPPEVIPKTNRPEWTTRNGYHYIAIGLHDFVARNSNELSFTKDSPLFIKPESMQPGSKWLIATLANEDIDSRKAKSIGFVPMNYVRILMK